MDSWHVRGSGEEAEERGIGLREGKDDQHGLRLNGRISSEPAGESAIQNITTPRGRAERDQ